MAFTHVSEIVLGEDEEERVELMRKVLQLGYPQGLIAWCPTCNEVEEFTLRQAAEHIAAGTWPRCHERRMLMDDPDGAPPF